MVRTPWSVGAQAYTSLLKSASDAVVFWAAPASITTIAAGHMANSGSVELTFEIVDPKADSEYLERSRVALQREIKELDIDVQPATLPAGDGAKGDVGLMGTLIVSALSSSVPALITLAVGWLRDRRPQCKLRVSRPDGTTVEIPQTMTREEVERLVA
jgi:hypothetical protein